MRYVFNGGGTDSFEVCYGERVAVDDATLRVFIDSPYFFVHFVTIGYGSRYVKSEFEFIILE